MGNPFEAIEHRLSLIEQHLSNMSNKQETPNNLREDSIGVDEAAKILQLAKATLYIKTHKKIVPHSKEGKMLIFSRRDLDAYLLQFKVKTLKEEIMENESLVSKRRVGAKNRNAA